MAFNNLLDYGLHPHPILACRLMNKYWKSIAEKVMETATISALEIELRGRSKCEQDRVKTIKSLIPTLHAVPDLEQGDDTPLEKIWCPSVLKDSVVNSFPFKSLQIKGADLIRTIPTSDFSQVPVLKLMSGRNLGHNLTSFILSGFHISPWLLQLLLQQMPNLKVLQLSYGYVIVDDDDVDLTEDQFKLPLLKQLKVLKVTDISVWVEPLGGFGPFGAWVVNSFVRSPTLSHLELCAMDNKLCLTLENFPNLKTLKLWYLKDNTIFNSECLPLEHLSINYILVSNITFEAFTNFLKKFAPTLVQLELVNVSMRELESTGFSFGKKVTSSFPNLKFFSWDYPLNQDAMQALALHFLPRFPALKRLELTEFRFSTEPSWNFQVEDDDDDNVPVPQGDINEIIDFLDRENYWAICSKLESIHVFHMWGSNIYVGYKKSEGSS